MITFDEAYKEYISYIKLKLKPTTILTKQYKINNYFLKYFSDMKINNFNEKIYIDWQNKIRDLNYSESFNNNLQSYIKIFFDYLYLNYKIENIPRKIGNFKSFNVHEKKEIKTITYKDYKKLYKASKNNIMYNTLFEVLYFTGIRKGEILALKWYDLNKKEISINKNITKECFNGKRIIQTPKSKNSIRKIKIDNKLYRKLKKLKKYYIKNNTFNKDNFIFGGNKPLATTTLDRYKDIYCNKANIPKYNIHAFRHGHATLLYEKKCDPKAIQKRLGHSNIETTLNVYVHSNKEKRVMRTLNLIRFIF